MRIRSLTFVVLLVGLAACGWTQPGFDAGHSQTNSFDAALTPTNLSTLEHHTVAVANASIQDAFVVGSLLIVNTATDAIAYDRLACPRSDSGPCTPVWTRTGETFKSSDGTSVMFFTTGAHSFEATNLAGTKLWDATIAPSSGLFNPDGFGISNGYLLVPIGEYLGHGSSATTMDVYAVTGCGAPSCPPARQILIGTGTVSFQPWAAAGSNLYAGVGAFDLTTGTQLWSFGGYNGATNAVAARNGLVYVARATTDNGTDVFDSSGSNRCSGLPKICQPIRHLPNGQIGAVGDRRVTSASYSNSSGPEAKLAFYPTDATGCTGSPSVCTPLATTGALGTSLNTIPRVAATNNVVFATGQVTGPLPVTNYSLYAFDAALNQGCSGTPKVCTPRFQFTSTNVSLSAPKIWDGRVYSVGSSGVLHVFSLPGAVS